MPAAVANPPISVTRLRPSRIPILLALLAALAHARQHDDGVASIHRDPDRGLDAALREKLELFDASADTSWPAERWNELVSERLRRLETLWREDRLAQGLAAVPGFAPDLPVPALLPDELEPAFANASWEIARAPGAEAQGPAGPKLADALASWRSAFAGDSRLDCQVFAVRCRPEEAVCGIRLTASGQGAGAGLQHNATWTCTWRASPSGIELVALRRDSFEVARLLERTEALFLDASEAVFGAGSLFREQLAPGLDFWRTRIPASLDLGFLSHHGIALGDVDGDGLEDLYLCQPGGLPNRLLLHLPGGAVRDVSAAAGVDVLDYSSSALLLELDEDGDVDLLVSTGNALLFYANDGEGRFEPRLEIERSLATSLCAADYDQDGDLDVFVCSYLSPYEKQGLPVPYHDANNGEANALLRNDGDWTFVDATSEVGMDENNRRFSFAAAWEDYDNDGDQDLYVANDFGRNNLYRNEAGRFRDLAGELGAEDVSAGMGVAWGDADGDGWMDLYVTNMYSPGGSRLTSQDGYHGDYSPETEEDYRHHAMGNSFLLNGRGGPFVDATRRSRAGVGGWAWGAIFLDFDNDGRLDLFSPNGFVTGERPGDLDSYFWRQVVLQSPERPGDPGRSYAGGWKAVNRLVRQGYSWNGHERNAAYLNLSGSSFADVSVTSGLGLMDDARTASRVDWDGDGDQDLFVTNRSGPRIRFLCNQRARDDRWIALRLRGTSCNRSAIGARAVLEGRSGERWIRTLRCGEGYLAQSSAGLHFGLGAAEIARLRVRWPGGEWEDFGCPRRGCAHLLVQGSGEAVPLPPAATRDFPGYMDRLSVAVDQLIAKAGVSRNEIAGMGAAVAGIVDPTRGHVARAQLLGWVDVPIRDLLSDTLGLPIIVDNLNNALCAAEFNFGLGRNKRNMMLFRVSYNTGASFFVEGKLAHGLAYGAGQISHMPITGGRVKCSCGARGCLNTVSSGLAVLSAYEKTPYAEVARADPESNTKRLFEMLERSETGDEWAMEVLRKSGSRFGRILNGFTIAFQPEQILLAGQVGSNLHFTNGVEKAVKNDPRPGGLHPDRIGVSFMTVAQSAVFLALSRFVFSESLDMKALKRNRPRRTTMPLGIAATR